MQLNYLFLLEFSVPLYLVISFYYYREICTYLFTNSAPTCSAVFLVVHYYIAHLPLGRQRKLDLINDR